MRKAAIVSAVASIPLLFTVNIASAQQLGTAAEARAMLDNAAAELKKDETAALDKFNKGRGIHVFKGRVVIYQASSYPAPGIPWADQGGGQNKIARISKDGIVDITGGAKSAPAVTYPRMHEDILERCVFDDARYDRRVFTHHAREADFLQTREIMKIIRR